MKYIKLITDELKNKGLSIYDKAVYSSLLTKYQYHGNQAFYTFESYIADELEISERTVKRSIKKLIETGLISVTKRYNKQLKQVINYYDLGDNNETVEQAISGNLDVETVDTPEYTKQAITDVITPDKGITPTDTPPQKANIDVIAKIIPDNTDAEITDNTDIYTDMETNNSTQYDFSGIEIDYRTDNERIAEAIEKSYSNDLQQINAVKDIKFSMLEDLGDKTDIKDLQIILDYIKQVRNIA